MKNMTKEERFELRLTKDEKNLLNTLAFQANKEVSDYVRDLVFDGNKLENYLLEIRRENYVLKKLLWGVLFELTKNQDMVKTFLAGVEKEAREKIVGVD